MTDHVRRGITVITHDGMTLPSILAACQHYGGVSSRKIKAHADWEGPAQLRVREDPRAGVRGVRCVLPDGSTYRSMSALARALGCSGPALYAHIDQHDGHTASFRSLPTQERKKQ